MDYIISQICAIIALAFLGSSYLVKDKSKILILGILATIMYGLEYLFLGALTGVLVNCIGIIRSVTFYYTNKKNKENSLLILIGLELLYIIATIFTWDGFISLIPLFAVLLFTFSTWYRGVKVYKWLAIMVSTLWVMYGVMLNSVFGYIGESILLITEIVGLIIYYKKTSCDNL